MIVPAHKFDNVLLFVTRHGCYPENYKPTSSIVDPIQKLMCPLRLPKSFPSLPLHLHSPTWPRGTEDTYLSFVFRLVASP